METWKRHTKMYEYEAANVAPNPPAFLWLAHLMFYEHIVNKNRHCDVHLNIRYAKQLVEPIKSES